MEFRLNLNEIDDKDIYLLGQNIKYAKTLFTQSDKSLTRENYELISNKLVAFFKNNENNPILSQFYQNIFISKNIKIPDSPNELTKEILEKIKNFKIKNIDKNLNAKFSFKSDEDINSFIKDWKILFDNLKHINEENNKKLFNS